MEAIFLLLLIFFFVLLYVIPSIILIGVFSIVIKWTISKFKDYGEPHDDYDDHEVCHICGDNEDWCKHAP
jgi:hypothetical protein